MQQILRRPALDRPDRLFVIIGRETFSAGQQFTNLLEAWTQAFDSLGEALLSAGYRDAAIAAYRQALVVEPGFPPSARALQRLGTPPAGQGGGGDAPGK